MWNPSKLRSLLRSDSAAHNLLFRATQAIGYIYTANPILVICISSVSALLALFVPASALGISHVPSAHGDVGFFAKKNWSLMYPLALPLFLALAGLACRTIYRAVCRFIRPGQAVIFDRDDNIATGYPEKLAEIMKARGLRLAISAGVVALIAVAIDTHDLWAGFFTGQFPPSRKPEWDTAFRLISRPGLFRWEVFCFDVIAYSFEFLYIFLGIFFIFTCWSFLVAIARIFDQSQPPYRLKPINCDLRKRLGLAPLAWVFHWLLFLGIAFGSFAAVHRFEQVDTLREQASGTYITGLFHNRQKLDNGNKGEADHSFSWESILNLAHQDYAFPELRNASSWLSIVFIALPGIVVCVLPLGRIYQYVSKTRERLLDQNTSAYDAAIARGDVAAAEKLRAQINCLREANIWPNGDTTAWTCLIVLAGVFVVSIAPPLLPFAVSAGALPALYKFVTKKRTET